MKKTIDVLDKTDSIRCESDSTECYAITRLLTDGTLHFADHDGNPNPEAYLEIRSLELDTDPGKGHPSAPVRFVRNSEQKTITLLSDGQVLNTLAVSELATPAAVEALLPHVTLRSINTRAGRPDVLRVEATDRFGAMHTMRFRLLSALGPGSTLLAASEATHFCFKAVGLTDEDAQRLNAITALPDWLNGILSEAQVVFEGIQSTVFRDNLSFIDTQMDLMLVWVLFNYYCGKGHWVNDLVDLLEKANPWELPESELYRFKFKQWLGYLARGMTAEHPWEGKEDATDGLIVVKEDGSVLGFLPYDRTHLESYLLQHTRFETPSRSHHHYGRLFKKADGSWNFYLTLHVRFTGKHNA